MNTDELHRLLKALETGNHQYFHGNIREAILDVVSELIDIKETIESVDGNPSLSDLVDHYELTKEQDRCQS